MRKPSCNTQFLAETGVSVNGGQSLFISSVEREIGSAISYKHRERIEKFIWGAIIYAYKSEFYGGKK